MHSVSHCVTVAYLGLVSKMESYEKFRKFARGNFGGRLWSTEGGAVRLPPHHKNPGV